MPRRDPESPSHAQDSGPGGDVQDSAASGAGGRPGPGSHPKPPPPTPPPPTPTPGDVSAVLLELLRKINAELPITPPLEGRAQAAVENFRRISADLRTLADGGSTSRTGAGGF